MTFQERLAAVSYKGPGFDQIRLAAATMVLLHHASGDVAIDPLFRYSGGRIHVGLLAVLVFFAISGFLVTPGLARTGNVVEYLVHRAVRIFPALVVVVLVSMLVLGPVVTSVPLSAYFSDRQLLLYARNMVTLVQSYLPGVVSVGGEPAVVNGALWTLHFEVLSYAALAALSVLGVLARRGLFLAAGVACYATYVAISFVPTLAAAVPERFVTFMSLFVYFQVGATLYVFRDRLAFSAALLTGAAVAIVAALPYGLGPVVMPLCLPYVVIFGGLSALPGRPKRDLSYGVYLIHAPMLLAFSVLVPDVRIPWPLTAAIVLVMTLGLAYLSSVFVEGPALARKKAISDWCAGRIDALLGVMRAPSRGAEGA